MGEATLRLRERSSLVECRRSWNPSEIVSRSASKSEGEIGEVVLEEGGKTLVQFEEVGGWNRPAKLMIRSAAVGSPLIP